MLHLKKINAMKTQLLAIGYYLTALWKSMGFPRRIYTISV
jgi:hypothetical protein